MAWGNNSPHTCPLARERSAHLSITLAKLDQIQWNFLFEGATINSILDPNSWTRINIGCGTVRWEVVNPPVRWAKKLPKGSMLGQNKTTTFNHDYKKSIRNNITLSATRIPSSHGAIIFWQLTLVEKCCTKTMLVIQCNLIDMNDYNW